MGAVTAREVLAMLERSGARLIAGAAGLDRPITWATAMRARPPAFESLQGGELALLALGTLRALHAQDDSLTLARLVADLAERQVAAIAVAGLLPAEAAPRTAGDGEQRSPTAEEIALAEAARLPLVALPAGTPIAEVERDVIAYVVARRSAVDAPTEERPRTVYDALMRSSLRGDDDRALGQQLAGQLGVAVALEDEGDLRWSVVPSGFPVRREALAALLRLPSSRALLGTPVGAPGSARAERIAPLGNGLVRLLMPLQARQGMAAALSLIVARPHDSPSPPSSPRSPSSGARDAEATLETLIAVLEQVAPLFALALARRHDLAGVERRLRAETLDTLLAGAYADDEQMRARAAQLGHDLGLPHAALVVELAAAAADGAPPRETALAAEIADGLGAALEGSWARARGGEVAALVPLVAPAPEAFARLAGRAGEIVRRVAGTGAGTGTGASGPTWSAGLGESAVGPVAIRHSFGEARVAARLGLQLLGPGQVARASDLGVYRLLLRLRDTGELEEYYHRTLGPLLADARAGEILIETLDTFFACNGNLSEAARRLHLHRNSLLYRLGRARELLGQDLEDPETRLALQIALKARRVLAL